MFYGNIERVIHRREPFRASRRADEQAKGAVADDPVRQRYFAARQVLATDGGFPFGEGFLYSDDEPKQREKSWKRGKGKPGEAWAGGHPGRKSRQEDAFGTLTAEIHGERVGVVAVADGVSASGPRSSVASEVAVEAFLGHLAASLPLVPANVHSRRAFLDKSLFQGAFVANLQVVQKALLGIEMDVMATFAEDPDGLSAHILDVRRELGFLAQRGITALTTIAVGVAFGSDLHTFNSGDSVVSLFRPDAFGEPGYIHLTERHQAVVELFNAGDNTYRDYPNLRSNVITCCFGGDEFPHGAIRQYPGLLEAGDRLVASTDGLGSRGDGEGGMTRSRCIGVLTETPGEQLVEALIEGQLSDLKSGHYQDNIGVSALAVD